HGLRGALKGMARPPASVPPTPGDERGSAHAAPVPMPGDARDPLTDPGLATPELPLAEARSFEGYISAMPIESQAAPISTSGRTACPRANLVNTPANTLLTFVFGALALYAIYGLLRFSIFDATWAGADREACLRKGGEAAGACWPMIGERL